MQSHPAEREIFVRPHEIGPRHGTPSGDFWNYPTALPKRGDSGLKIED